MEILLTLVLITAVLGAIIYAGKRTKGRPPASPPVNREDVPKDYSGKDGWFGRKDRD